MPHPSIGTVTVEALLTGLVIAIIGIISYYLYVVASGTKTQDSSNGFWGMTASLFFVGVLAGFFAEYSGINRRFCVFNYGTALTGRV